MDHYFDSRTADAVATLAPLDFPRSLFPMAGVAFFAPGFRVPAASGKTTGMGGTTRQEMKCPN